MFREMAGTFCHNTRRRQPGEKDSPVPFSRSVAVIVHRQGSFVQGHGFMESTLHRASWDAHQVLGWFWHNRALPPGVAKPGGGKGETAEEVSTPSEDRGYDLKVPVVELES